MTINEHLLLKELGYANAFPQAKEDIKTGSEYGLTKREYFAAMAMQGFITTDVCLIDDCARYAVKAADALIAELNK
jgi:hypothetical protein